MGGSGILRAVVLSFLIFSLPSFAVIETYEFGDDGAKARYQQMIDDLRCPKCQNQNLSGSNSPIAKDLRREVHRLITEGQSNENIKAFMVKRYGNYVLYEPPVDKNTYMIWGLPFILLVLAFLVAIMVKKRATSDSHMPYLDQREKDRIAQILKKYS